MNDKIYLPNSSYACYDYLGNGVIRAFPQTPRKPTTNTGSISNNYIDFYFNDGYLSRTGSVNYSYNSVLPSCALNSKITTDIFYRVDIDRVLVTFFILFIFIIYIPWLLIKKLFKKRSFV